MPGRAYNPKGFEPNLHGALTGFYGKGREALDKVYEIQWQERAERRYQNAPYQKAREYLERGEGDLLGHYVYEMMYDIYAGIEDEVLDGCVDTHLHIWPDYVPRTTDVIRLAINASKVGYRALVCKDHFFTNVGMCWAAQWVAEDLVRRGELKQACKVFGTHVLAWSFDPEQIHLISKYPNLGEYSSPLSREATRPAGLSPFSMLKAT